MRVGKELYALSVEHVLEIAEIGDLTPLPGAGAAVLGVRNLHGQVLPVFDLATVLGLAGGGAPSRLIVAEARGRKAGLAIDEVTDVGDLPETSERDGVRVPHGDGAGRRRADRRHRRRARVRRARGRCCR